MEELKNKIMNTKILGIVGCALTILGTFLPFATVSAKILGSKYSESVNYIEGDGKFVLILSLIALATIFADELADKIPFFEKLKNIKYVLGPVAISAIIIIYDMASGHSAAAEAGSLAKVSISYGIGAWVMFIGLAATAAYTFIYKKSN